PRQVDRRVPRDLDAICLKCLEKEPGRRYTDCGALAEDLRRWLHSEPTTAQPLRLPERLGRWVKREPRLAAAVALALGLLVAVAGLVAVSAHREAENALRQGELRQAASDEARKALEAEQQALADADAARKARDHAEAMAYFSQIGRVDAQLLARDH